ncbi:MAG: hypothetical protein NTW93_04615 [Phycisphaerae bacterium]|nr:hypothetical protein [Phycisphaerae bacterium]
MKKLAKNVKRILLSAVLLSFTIIPGCGDNQSNKVVNVGNISVEIVGTNKLDAWKVGGGSQGPDICGAAFGFMVQLNDYTEEHPYPEAGIRVDVEVTRHRSPSGFGDIWATNAPNGQKYGFIVSDPEEGSGTNDEGIFHCRTNGQGQVFIFPGLGQRNVLDANAPLDYGFLWPRPVGSYNDVVDSEVELKITVHRRQSPPPPVYVKAHFYRWTYMNFWWPTNAGVYAYSTQGLGQISGYSMMANSVYISTEAGIPYEKSPVPSAPKDSKAEYPVVSKTVKTLETITPNSVDLTQRRWDPQYGWAYFLIEPNENLHALWANDLNDVNDIKDMLSVSQPYAYWVVLDSNVPFYGSTATATVHLRAMDSLGDVKSMIPLKMHLHSKSADNKTLTFVSDWFIISEDPEFNGTYEDNYSNSYTVIYMPTGTYPDIDLPPNGDFNADGHTDYKDLCMLSGHWLSSLETDANNYDLLYEEPNNIDGSIDFRDFAAFADNWMID